jgi:hypothetical protein
MVLTPNISTKVQKFSDRSRTVPFGCFHHQRVTDYRSCGLIYTADCPVGLLKARFHDGIGLVDFMKRFTLYKIRRIYKVHRILLSESHNKICKTNSVEYSIVLTGLYYLLYTWFTASAAPRKELDVIHINLDVMAPNVVVIFVKH